jgi:hypothetical protein
MEGADYNDITDFSHGKKMAFPGFPKGPV